MLFLDAADVISLDLKWVLRDKQQKKKSPKIQMFACINIMNVDNPAPFIVAPLYVHLMAAPC